jgi:hypothetical protein
MIDISSTIFLYQFGLEGSAHHPPPFRLLCARLLGNVMGLSISGQIELFGTPVPIITTSTASGNTLTLNSDVKK